MDLGFGPHEGLGVLVVAGDKRVYVLAELRDIITGKILEGLAMQDREPNFDLIEPTTFGRCEMEVNVRSAL